MAGAPRQHGRQHRLEQVQRAQVIDLVVAQHVGQVQARDLAGFVVAGAVHHAVQRPLRQQLLGRVLHGGGIGRIKLQGLAARVGQHKVLQGLRLACGHHHAGALAVQGAGGGLANATGGAHDPDGFAVPVGQRRIQRGKQ